MTEKFDVAVATTSPVGKEIDAKTMEILAYTAFRAFFGKEIRLPIKLSGVMDLDVVVRDTNVTVNLHSVQMQSPELTIWRFILAYQDKPIMEYGRGIKNDMKIHIFQTLFLFLELWRARRKKYRARARAAAAMAV
jgi:hypothetical protein